MKESRQKKAGFATVLLRIYIRLIPFSVVSDGMGGPTVLRRTIHPVSVS